MQSGFYQTETTIVVIDGDHLQFDIVSETISSMGATIHSIDEVEVIGLQPESE